MLTAASITLESTSLILVSTSLATNGNDATTSGTTEAPVPTTVSTMNLVIGVTMIIKMRNGTDLKRFIKAFNPLYRIVGIGIMPSFSPVTRIMPSGKPIAIAAAVAITVM